MNQPPFNSEPSNNDLARERTEWAKYRGRAAADRTLMAWIRTSLSLIGFGFGIPTIVNALGQTRLSHNINTVRVSTVVRLAFIGTGMLAMALGLKEHHQLLQKIKSDRYTYESSPSVRIIGIALLWIGVISFIGVVIRALSF